MLALALVGGLAVPTLWAQSGSQTQPPAGNAPAQDIPDAPSAVQPPPPKPAFPDVPPGAAPAAKPPQDQNSQTEEKPAPPPMPPVVTLAPGSTPRNMVNPDEQLYKVVVKVNFVQVPVLVKDSSGGLVYGLRPEDFTVLENGKKQKLTYFTTDPFELSVAILLDTGMPDVAVQKMNETYGALVGSLSPYDEAAIYTYSSTVSQVTDYTSKSQKLLAALNEVKSVRGRNGPAVLNGPLAEGPPAVNGAPVGGPTIAPVNTPEREDHVLNDAILRAALDLSKRERTRRKVIFVVTDGRELGSQASYRDVLRILESRDIQVKGVVVDSGSLPLFREVGKIHLPHKQDSNIPFVRGQGYSDLLPKYTHATGGGEVQHELSRNAIEDAYAEITREVRNQYTLGYSAQATTGSSAYRSIEVRVDRRGLKVQAKDGYYPRPVAR